MGTRLHSVLHWWFGFVLKQGLNYVGLASCFDQAGLELLENFRILSSELRDYKCVPPLSAFLNY